MSLPEWIVDRLSPKDPERRERSDRRFFWWVGLPVTLGWLAWKACQWFGR